MTDPAANLRAATRFAQGRYAKSAQRIPGHVLMLFRQAAGVDQVDVAGALGVTKQRVNNIEREGCPLAYAERYRTAVEAAAFEE